MTTRSSHKSIESRSVATLRLKVATHKAAGWVVDGPVLEVTDFSHRRPVTRYCQEMIKPLGWTPLDWSFA
jgi:hypothetical protein